MGQCGCGETRIDRAFLLKDGSVLAYDLYRGCADCFPGLGVNLYFFDNPSSEWIDHCKIEKAPAPDEYGGAGGHGLAFPLFDVDDLRAEAKSLSIDMADYDGLDDVLADYGLELIQGAVRRAAVKRAGGGE